MASGMLSPRAHWREAFIARQLQGLAGLGLSPEALKREEVLLRGGFAVATDAALPSPFGAQRLEGGDAVAHQGPSNAFDGLPGCEGRGG